MATTATLRFRRTAAQRHALLTVEREIRATDPYGRRKYLRDFNQAYTSYHSVLPPAQLQQALGLADTLLIGDYHALPAAQRYCARLLAERAALSSRPLVLAVEAVFARHQQVLDEWLAGEIDEQELRERTRYDLDWQYDWAPFYELLQTARRHGAHVYGIDCTPRGDMRRIFARDQHAAQKIAALRQQDPEAQIIVLFGESHLAPSHLPALLKELVPGDRILTVLQNLDALYWKAAGERNGQVDAVRICDGAICVFNATPLEKYESYRLYLERWRAERPSPPDLAPVFYNLIEALLESLGIDKYDAPGRAPAPIVDLFPEVYCRNSEQALHRLLLRKHLAPREAQAILDELRTHGCCYVQRLNALFAVRLNVARAAELAAEFLRCACAGEAGVGGVPSSPTAADDRFYYAVLQHALLDVGSRVLYPARAPVREADYYALYGQTKEAVECRSLYSYREYLDMIDFLLLHKDYERNRAKYLHVPELIERARNYSGSRWEFVTRELGLMLGNELYDAYLMGAITRRSLRALFCLSMRKPGEATMVYFTAVRRVRRPRRLLAA